MKKNLPLAVCVVALVTIIAASASHAFDRFGGDRHPSDLDRTGANHYILRLHPCSTPQPPNDAASFAQPDGTTLIVGSPAPDSTPGFSRAFAIWKRNADGTPDTTFNGDGFVTIPIWGYDDRARSLAVQPDGKIVVAGHAWDPICSYTCEDRVAIARLNSDGTLDQSFNGNGVIAIVMVYAGGGIINGEPGGEVSFDRSDVVILADGTIEIQNSPEPRGNSAYVRVHADGTLDGAVDNVFGQFVAREAPLVFHTQGL